MVETGQRCRLTPDLYTTRSGQTRTSTYDLRGREILADWSAPGGGQPATPDVTKGYDAAGRLLALDNGNASLTYAWDAANQLLSETQQPAGQPARVVGYTYDVRRQL